MQPFPLSLEITPYEAVGSLRFGMTAPQIVSELAPHRSTREGACVCARFEDLGVRVYYGRNGGLEAVELRAPAQPTLSQQPLLGQTYRSLEAWLGSVEPNLKLEHSGLTSIELGIRLYAASARRFPDTPVEVVTVFARDYYRQYIASITPPP
ncbi:MAG: hypothetical protein MUF54_05620 [Polyangiaceae bacterium]|jgi:hypothetical protein|nr:hypothetical protein [Polyangiaceae bacterium]